MQSGWLFGALALAVVSMGPRIVHATADNAELVAKSRAGSPHAFERFWRRTKAMGQKIRKGARAACDSAANIGAAVAVGVVALPFVAVPLFQAIRPHGLGRWPGVRHLRLKPPGALEAWLVDHKAQVEQLGRRMGLDLEPPLGHLKMFRDIEGQMSGSPHRDGPDVLLVAPERHAGAGTPVLVRDPVISALPPEIIDLIRHNRELAARTGDYAKMMVGPQLGGLLAESLRQPAGLYILDPKSPRQPLQPVTMEDSGRLSYEARKAVVDNLTLGGYSSFVGSRGPEPWWDGLSYYRANALAGLKERETDLAPPVRVYTPPLRLPSVSP